VSGEGVAREMISRLTGEIAKVDTLAIGGVLGSSYRPR
jgi:hypothetical protein